jgi:dihydrofolate reductase
MLDKLLKGSSMSTPRINIIAAIGRNRELGKKNELIWHIPADLKRFRALTMGHPIIMGRKTFESIGRPLPGRTNIVVSETITDIPGCIVSNTLHHALADAEEMDRQEIFVIGGTQIYKTALLYANRLYITRIDAEDPEADVFFPEYSDFSNVIDRTPGAEGDFRYEWLTLEREPHVP